LTAARALGFAATVVLGLATSGRSQDMSQAMMMLRPPNIPGVQFDQEVGAGAEYRIGSQFSLALVTVGKESVDGQDGYWMEARLDGGPNAKLIMKVLLVGGAMDPDVKRIVIQLPGRPPMEVPQGELRERARDLGGRQPSSQWTSQSLGSENMTVSAGTFECQHFRITNSGKTADYWISPSVHAYGIVKMASSDGTSLLVLKRVLEHETSQIHGEPQKMTEALLTPPVSPTSPPPPATMQPQQSAPPRMGQGAAPTLRSPPTPQTLPTIVQPQQGTPGSTAVNSNAQLVVHFGLTTTGNWATDYCVGVMTIQNGYLTYRAVKGTHVLHAFDFPLASIKEVKKNGFLGSAYQAFHVRMKTGENTNFALLDETGQRFLNPGPFLAVISAVMEGK
jgi:hypothetical protein